MEGHFLKDLILNPVKEIIDMECRYCHFECLYKGDEEECPLVAFEKEHPLASCSDVECEHNCDCDVCISYREG